jgi:hypothetical protein
MDNDFKFVDCDGNEVKVGDKVEVVKDGWWRVGAVVKAIEQDANDSESIAFENPATGIYYYHSSSEVRKLKEPPLKNTPKDTPKDIPKDTLKDILKPWMRFVVEDGRMFIFHSFAGDIVNCFDEGLTYTQPLEDIYTVYEEPTFSDFYSTNSKLTSAIVRGDVVWQKYPEEDQEPQNQELLKRLASLEEEIQSIRNQLNGE